MRVVLLAGASSIHTQRWANGLASMNYDVHLISNQKLNSVLHASVNYHEFSFGGKLGYFMMVPAVRDLINKINPDIVNAHYASGYGTTANLVNFHPWLLSVWGSDIYDFPYKSPLHRYLIRRNLLAADGVASTSYCMADEARNLVPELDDISITPFGVDHTLFSNIIRVCAKQTNKLVIGTVKTMNPKYGVDTLVEAFALLNKSLRNKQEIAVPDIELRLVGGGGQTPELQALAVRLGVADKITFVGQVPHAQVPHELCKLDIYVALSRQESFGVAVIEAGAAGCPVVVSDAGGLPEVTVDGVTGFVVPRENPLAAAAAMERLVLDAKLRKQMGMAGQSHVNKHYSWGACLQTMSHVYEKTIWKHKK